MALVYAFVDEDSCRYGEEDLEGTFIEFRHTPPSGRFAGRRLLMHAASWESDPSGIWIVASERMGYFATTDVDELLWMDPTPPSRLLSIA